MRLRRPDRSNRPGLTLSLLASTEVRSSRSSPLWLRLEDSKKDPVWALDLSTGVLVRGARGIEAARGIGRLGIARGRTPVFDRNTVPGSIPRPCHPPDECGAACPTKELSQARSLGRATPSVDRGSETGEKVGREGGLRPRERGGGKGIPRSSPACSTGALTRRGRAPKRAYSVFAGPGEIAEPRFESEHRAKRGWRRSRHR